MRWWKSFGGWRAEQMPEVKIVRRYVDDPDQYKIDTYIRHGGYEPLKKALAEMRPDDLVEMGNAYGLRGRGGAGASDGINRKFLAKRPNPQAPNYLIANADQTSPG